MVDLIQIQDIEFFMDNAAIWDAHDKTLYLATVKKSMISIGTKSDETEYDKEYVQEKGLPVKQI